MNEMMKNQKGGALISEGGYGCIFYPSIKTKENYKYVSKIQKNNFDSRNEAYIGNILKDVPSYLNHFVPVMDSDDINVKKIDDDDVGNCTIFMKYKDTPFINMKIRYVNGKNFLDYIVNNKSSSFNFTKLLVNSYNHLLSTLDIMVNLKIVHYDLKGNNIMFDSSNQLPLILDFGLSIKMDEIKIENLTKHFYTYAPEYSPWALELHYINFLLKVNPNPTNKDLEEMARRFVNSDTNPVSIVFSREFIGKFEKSCLNQLKKYNRIPTLEKKLKTLYKYYDTWDNYALSVIYITIFHFIYPSFNKNNFIEIMVKILLQNIHPDPEKRLKVKETVNMFNEKLLDFVNNVENYIFIKNINSDFIENKSNFEREAKKFNNAIETVSKTMSKITKK